MSTTTRHWIWLLIFIGGPFLLVLIFVCACLFMHRRARDLGVLPRRHYSFYVSGCVLPPPQSLGPITSHGPSTAGSLDNLICSDPASSNSIHRLPTIVIDTVQEKSPWRPYLEVNSIKKYLPEIRFNLSEIQFGIVLLWDLNKSNQLLWFIWNALKSLWMLLWNKRIWHVIKLLLIKCFTVSWLQ